MTKKNCFEMDEDSLAQLHDDLVNSKSQRGKFGGIGAGRKRSILLDGPARVVNKTEISKLPDRPLYKRFVLAAKSELCRHTIVSTLESHGGKMRWKDLALLVAEECGEPMTNGFKYRFLSNLPESCLSNDSPLVHI